MSRGKNPHVVPNKKSGWDVKGAGNKKSTSNHPTQKEVIKKAEEIAKNQKSDTKIHGKDGKIRAGNSYGNDPYPPKDKK